MSGHSGVSSGPGLGSQNFSGQAPVPGGPDGAWQTRGTWETVRARKARCTFGSSGPHEPWGSWESFTTWVSGEALEAWCSVCPRESWCPLEALGPWGAWGSRQARRSLGPSDTTWWHDLLSVTSEGPFHICVTVYLSGSAWGARGTGKAWWSR